MQPAKGDFCRTPPGIAALGALLICGIWLRVTNLDNISFRSPDERTYTNQAIVVLNRGTAGIRTLASDYLRNVQHPARAAYVWLVAASMRVTGYTDERAGAYLSCAASIGSLIVAAIIALRFLPGWAPFPAILLFSVSPPELAVAVRAWGDAAVGFFALILFWMTAEITRDPNRRIWYLLFVLAGIGEFVIKESGIAIFVLSSIALVRPLIRGGDWKNGFSVAAAAIASTALSVAWLAYSLGGFSAFVDVTKAFFRTNGQNPYVLEFQTGPGHWLLEAFWMLSPAAAFFCLIGLAVVAFTREHQSLHAGISFMLVFLAVPIVLPHWLNLRYMTLLFGPWCLMAGLGCWYAVSTLSRQLGNRWARLLPVLAIGLTAVAAWGDYRRFQTIFLERGVGDLSIRLILPKPPDDLDSAELQARVRPTAENYLYLSFLYHQNRRFRESIDAAKEALKRNPRLSEAYNNVAAGNNNLGIWDEAIRASTEALRINPDDPFARKNLDVALSGKKKSE